MAERRLLQHQLLDFTIMLGRAMLAVAHLQCRKETYPMARDMSWNMSKKQALANVAICLGLAAVFFILQLSGCGTIFLLLAIWPALIWLVKALRDERIATIAKQSEASQLTEHVEVVPKESGNNQGLFLPPQKY